MLKPFDPLHLLNRQFEPIEHSWDALDCQLYALGVGLGGNPLNCEELSYVYEGLNGNSLQVLPTFANVLAYPGFWAREPDTGIAWQKVVHAEQEIFIHEPLPAIGSVVGQTSVIALWDKGAEKGALMQQSRELRNKSDGRLFATVKQLSLLRGNGGFNQVVSDGEAEAPHLIPTRVPDAVCDLSSVLQAALIYRLSGDLNPLHADPAVAKSAGFDRPILHGMATMGMAAHAVIATILGYQATRLLSMKVRFTAPVIPGDSLRTEMWVDGSVISFRTRAIERNVVVLNNSKVHIR